VRAALLAVREAVEDGLRHTTSSGEASAFVKVRNLIDHWLTAFGAVE
jgi:uncharacterized heparinase superfamily protein